MRAIWELIETSIIPIITYGSEGWNPNKEERELIQTIFNNALKDILQLPQGTPTTILLAETGFIPIEMIIKKKKMNQQIRIMEKPEEKLIKKATRGRNSQWTEQIKTIEEEYGVDITNNQITKPIMNHHINKENIEKFQKHIDEERKNKSKIEHWITRKNDTKPGKRPEYMNRLGRKQCSAIIRVRSRMMPTKTNMQGNFTDKNCRMCKKPIEETQQHILQECEEIGRLTNQVENYNDIFQDGNVDSLRQAANIIIKIREIMETRLQQP